MPVASDAIAHPAVSLTALAAGTAGPGADDLAGALQSSGYCYIGDLGPLLPSLDAAVSAARGFFAQPEEAKLRVCVGRSARHCGYVPFTESGLYGDETAGRRYEAFDFGLEDKPDEAAGGIASLFHGANQWPELPGFREAVYGYFLAVRAVAHSVTGALARCLGVPTERLHARMTRATSQLRLINYAGTPLPLDASDMGKHTDYEFFTLLHQTAAGLQVLDRGGRWREVPPRPGTLVMLVGNLLEVASNGRFRSTPHRVKNSAFDRLSIPFFAAFDAAAVVVPLNAPRSAWRYRPVVAGEHLLEQVTRDFAYLRQRMAEGRHALPRGLPEGNPFDPPDA